MKNLRFIVVLLLLISVPTFEVSASVVKENSEDTPYTEKKVASSSISEEEKKNILISEFYPNPLKGGHEWVEIYNANSSKVDLKNWKIDDIIGGGSSPIVFSATIPPKYYFVLEFSKNILNNSGEDAISLVDEKDFPLHIINYKKTIQGRSIQKIENLGWFITSSVTKGKKNLSYVDPISSSLLTIKSSSTNKVYNVNKGSISAKDKQNITITEFYPYPKKGKKEWVEVYNKNDHAVVLNNWYIDDKVRGGGSPFLFSIKLNRKSYGVVEIPKSLLNNAGDSVSLLDENKFPLHVIKYSKSVKGSSIQLLGSKWYITEDTTKGAKNISFKEYKNLRSKEDFVVRKLDLVEPVTKNPALGSVLGVSSSKVYRTIPIYKPHRKKYLTFSDSKGKVFVITEKQIPNSFDRLVSFFEKAFW